MFEIFRCTFFYKSAIMLILEDQPVVPKPEKPVDLTPRIIEPLEEALTITDDCTVELVCRISNVTADDVVWTKNERMARKGSRFVVIYLLNHASILVIY